MIERWRVWGCIGMLLWGGISCSQQESADYQMAEAQVESGEKFAEMVEEPSAQAPLEANASDEAPAAEASSTSSPEGTQEAKKAGPLLIYNGTILLALYDIAATQTKIVNLIEAEGGWVSTRSSTQIVLRVPAPQFRAMLDKVAGMGDVIDMSWQAQDVTAVVNDTTIRLDSALAMRERLQELLVRADDVKDALAIEEQLARVILEIEQLQATLRGYKDRIAYSTITVEFRAKVDQEIPDDEFSLPFAWLDQLGAQRLLDIPRL